MYQSSSSWNLRSLWRWKSCHLRSYKSFLLSWAKDVDLLYEEIVSFVLIWRGTTSEGSFSHIGQGLTNFICKAPGSKYIRISRKSVLPFWHESCPRQYINEEAWLHSNKTLCMDPKIWNYIILMGRKIFFFFWLFFNHLQMQKPFLACGPYVMGSRLDLAHGALSVNSCYRCKTSTYPLLLGDLSFLPHPLGSQLELHWELQGSLKILGGKNCPWVWAFKRSPFYVWRWQPKEELFTLLGPLHVSEGQLGPAKLGYRWSHGQVRMPQQGDEEV